MDKKQAFNNARYELRSTVPKKEEPAVRTGPGRLQVWTKYLDEELKAAGVETDHVSPLLLPHYARHER